MSDWLKFLQDLYLAYQVVFDILITIIAAIVLRLILVLISRLVVRRIVHRSNHKKVKPGASNLVINPAANSPARIAQRAKTLGTVLENLITWVIVIVAVIVILDRLHVPVTAIVASAGIMSAAIGFGAQNIIKDVLGGMLMLSEDQIGVGDRVDLGLATGVIESVGVRTTIVRDDAGVIWFVRNGEIVRVGNYAFHSVTDKFGQTIVTRDPELVKEADQKAAEKAAARRAKKKTTR